MLRILPRRSRPTRTASRTPGRRILLVDPDPASRDIGCLLLRYFGYEVQAAATFPEALHLARAARPAAVICELVEDGAGGRTLVEELAEHPETAGTPVIVLTTRVLPGERERAESAGAASFLAKPCDGEHLRAVLAGLLGDPQAGLAAAAASGRA